MPRASIIIPTYNGADLLPTVLSAVGAQDYGDDYEIIVVDDGSRDNTPRVLEEWRLRLAPKLKALHQENAGPATARNSGAREARGSFLAFIDDDCVAEPSWLRSLEAVLQEAGTAAVAGAVVNPQGSWVGRYVNRESVIAQGISAEGLVTDLITGNAAVRTAVFRELGGFDETIRVAGGEDTDFGYRLRSAGHRIVYAPAARVHHESRVDLFGYLRMIFRHGRGRRRLGERFPSYRLRLPYLRLFWLSWPLRSWMPKDYRRYRSAAVSAPEALAYVLLRYLENLARVAGYIRGA